MYLMSSFIEKKSTLRCATPVCGTSKHKYLMPKSKVQKRYKSYLTFYLYHLLGPDIKYVTLRHKTKFQNHTLADFRHCEIYVKQLAHLRHITRQAETHAPPSSLNRTILK